MSMNIKSAETHRLARELAEITGESLTTAVTVAVRERLTRVKVDQAGGLAERLMQIGRESAPKFREAGITFQNYDDFLYDEHGLPR